MKKFNGFTLLELSVVMGIICLVVIAAAPLHSWLRRQGAGLATEQLRGDLQMARLMAINRKQTCAIVVNAPSKNQYLNSLNRQCVDLASYRGGVHFLQRGPDGTAASDAIMFNRRGMAISLGSIYLADEQMSDIYRVRVMTPGGISVFRWSGDGWD